METLRNANTLVARNFFIRRAKTDSDRMLEASAEKLLLVMGNESLKKELAALQALDDSRKKQNEELKEKVKRQDDAIIEMQRELNSKEETIEGLREEVAKGVDNTKKD